MENKIDLIEKREKEDILLLSRLVDNELTDIKKVLLSIWRNEPLPETINILNNFKIDIKNIENEQELKESDFDYGDKLITKTSDSENIPEKLIDCIDNYFPKGDKRRGQALALQAVSYLTGKEQGKKESDKEIKNLEEKRKYWENMYKKLYTTLDKVKNINWKENE
jgi:hypothetical protein